jgi:DNA-binding MurR/RpiR family transcriptional regulator
VEIAERIRAQSTSLTAAERRVAEAILAAPQAVGFGTVADLAHAADVGAASVVRLAAKLGFDGYSALQACVQRDLVRQLRPAAERILETEAGGVATHLAAELANVQATLDAADEVALAALATRLADLSRPVRVVSGEATAGVAAQFVTQMHQLRPNVAVLIGTDVAVRREIAVLPQTATVIVIDLRRYERWVLDAHAMLEQRGVWTAGITDSMLSPIAARSAATFIVSAASSSPFDSHVGTLALLNMVTARAAVELRAVATDRLATVEAAWHDHGALTDGN